MYIPKHFEGPPRAEVVSFLETNNFGALVVNLKRGMEAIHLPFIVKNEEKIINEAHISRGNQIRSAIENQQKGLLIVTGPHYYISPTYYDHENVPTWNYQAVHASGNLEVLEGMALKESLQQLVRENEYRNGTSFSMDELSEKFVKREIKGIVGFRLIVNDLQVQYKLSQNRDKKNYEEIVSSLEQKNNAEAAKLAAAMRKNQT